MNITDIDDKIIMKANEQGKDHRELSEYWETNFFTNMDKLLVKRPDKLLRVSQHVPDIVDYIEQIIENGFAYRAGGSVYFDVKKYQDMGYRYCKLVSSAFQSGTDSDGTIQVSPDKRHPADFALWKAAKNGEPSWHSPWGRGRPGWHIECSAMIQSSLKPNQLLELHTGGSDLRFPHHTNEIAQGEAYQCTKDWVKYFLHVAPLTISGLKMSKSLKNFITIEEALHNASGQELRLLFLSHHYSKTMQFNPEGSIIQAKAMLRSISNCIQQLDSRLNGLPPNSDLKEATQAPQFDILHTYDDKVTELLRNDFNFPAVIQELILLCKQVEKLSNETDTSPSLLDQAKSTILKTSDEVLGLGLQSFSNPLESRSSLVSKVLEDFVEYRYQIVQATKAKDISKLFKLSDEVRDSTLLKYGLKIEDKVDTKHQYQQDKWKKTQVNPTIELIESKPKTGNVSIFNSSKYAKFKIGKIGEDGLPELDVAGKPFPQKVKDRFTRDLQVHQDST